MLLLLLMMMIAFSKGDSLFTAKECNGSAFIKFFKNYILKKQRRKFGSVIFL